MTIGKVHISGHGVCGIWAENGAGAAAPGWPILPATRCQASPGMSSEPARAGRDACVLSFAMLVAGSVLLFLFWPP